MSCKFVTQKGINCKSTDEYMVYFNDGPTNDFIEYKNYIDYDLQVCSNCGYISENIETIANLTYNIIKNTKEFNNVLNYSYLNDYTKNIDTQKLYSYPDHLYECYGMIPESSMHIDHAIRAYFRCVVLKETIVKRYQKERQEDIDEFDDIEVQNYKNLEEAITQSIKTNLIKIIELYPKSSQQKFINIIYIECLLRFFKVKDAENVYNQIKNKIDNQLRQYIENLIEQRR